MTIRTIFCVGRNYRAHAAELHNALPTEPLLFTKPAQAALQISNKTPLSLPKNHGSVHYETELVVRLKTTYDPTKPLAELIESVGLGLDLTLRDVQSVAKEKGLPWLLAKGFKNSAILTKEVPFINEPWWNTLQFSLTKNNEIVQIGKVSDLIFSLRELLDYIDEQFGLGANDLVFTGTPAGVGPIHPGDTFTLTLGTEVLGSCHF